MFKGKTLVITGGTGSFGNAALERFLKTDIKEIRIFSRDEKKQDDMRQEISDGRVKYYIGDVRNYNSVKDATVGADYVFHAAALKQVPSCEFYPLEAIKTNTLGAENVLNAAIANNVKKVILLSTDKAVYPVNAMGLSKALMEKIMVAKSRIVDEKKIVVCATRYGNVMCSRGSVIPLFIKQIKSKQPLTVTEPKMTRFMMSLQHAIDLVMFAFNNARPGDLFVKKAPACTILDLAHAIKNIFKTDVPIKTIGMRHGEKLYETLVTMEESRKAEDMGDYFRISMDARDLNYAKYFTEGDVEESTVEDYTSHNTYRLSVAEIEKLLVSLPEVAAEL